MISNRFWRENIGTSACDQARPGGGLHRIQYANVGGDGGCGDNGRCWCEH